MPNKNNYSDWSKKELIEEIVLLKKKKTYGLVWERDKTKEIFDYYINWDGVETKEIFKGAENKFPVLKEVKNKEIITDKNKDYNLLIEGDNYHSLAVLNFTHKNSIDLIYIDPPYNTGNKDFKYNDKWIDKEDAYKHSKWLSFMEKRLKLSRPLLNKNGLIFISIDDNELAQLKILCDEVFGEDNFISTLPTIMNLKGNQDQFGFAGTHEYTLVYCKNKTYATIGEFQLNKEELANWEKDEYGYYKKGANLKATGVNAPREKRPNLYFPIFFNSSNSTVYASEDNKPVSKTHIKIYPITDGKQMSWRWSKKKINSEPYNIIITNTTTNFTLYKKQRPKLGDLPSKKPKSLFYRPEYSSGNGTREQKNIFHKKVFNNPKPTELIKDIISLYSNKNAIILDFMAGSGTTAHSTLQLNNEDGGNRKFILCTNNENNICTDVCQPRIEKIIKGYFTPSKNKIKGLGGNLKYFKTTFVDSSQTDANKKRIVDKSTEMICIKEGAFELIEKSGSSFKIFKNNSHYLGIVFEEDSIEDFIETIKKIDGLFNVYVFSLDENVPDKEFSSVSSKVNLQSIPEAILQVYRKIFKDD